MSSCRATNAKANIATPEPGWIDKQRTHSDGCVSEILGARDDWAPEEREVGFQVQDFDGDGL